MWAIILDAVGLFSLWLLTRKHRAGFLVGVGAMGLWLAYAVDTGQWGFLPGIVVYAWVHLRGFVRWGGDEHGNAGVSVWGNVDGADDRDRPLPEWR